MQTKSIFLFLCLSLSSMAQARDAVVLQDNIAWRESASTTAKPIETLRTGDQADVITEQGGWYQLSRKEKKGWAPSESIFVFDNATLYSEFINGTFPVFLENAPEDVQKKALILNSYDFYARALANPNAPTREHAALRILYYEKDANKRGSLWQKMQADADSIVRTNANQVLTDLDQAGIVFKSPSLLATFKKSFHNAATLELDSLVRLMLFSRTEFPSKNEFVLNAAQRRSLFAISQLKQLDKPAVKDVLWKHLQDEDAEVRENVYAALSNGQPEPRVIEALLKRYASSDVSEQSRINFVFRTLPAHPAVRRAVRAALQKTPPNYSLSQTALTLLDKKFDADLSLQHFKDYVKAMPEAARLEFREDFCIDNKNYPSAQAICDQ